MDTTLQFLKDLVEAHGTPGAESPVVRVLERHLKGVGDHQPRPARQLHLREAGTPARRARAPEPPRVMLAGHLDEVGFMVKSVTKEGFVKFLPLGGWWGHVVLGAAAHHQDPQGRRAWAWSARSRRTRSARRTARKVLEIKDLYIDVGATSDWDVRKQLDIRPGDPIVPESPFTVMANPDLLLAKAWDNRIGCAIAAEVARRLRGRAAPEHASSRWRTVQEEVGLRGAQTSAFKIQPDVGHRARRRHRARHAGHRGRREAGRRPADRGLRRQRDPQPRAARPGDRHGEEAADPAAVRGGGARRHRRRPHPPERPGRARRSRWASPARYIHSHVSIISRQRLRGDREAAGGAGEAPRPQDGRRPGLSRPAPGAGVARRPGRRRASDPHEPARVPAGPAPRPRVRAARRDGDPPRADRWSARSCSCSSPVLLVGPRRSTGWSAPATTGRAREQRAQDASARSCAACRRPWSGPGRSSTRSTILGWDVKPAARGRRHPRRGARLRRADAGARRDRRLLHPGRGPVRGGRPGRGQRPAGDGRGGDACAPRGCATSTAIVHFVPNGEMQDRHQPQPRLEPARRGRAGGGRPGPRARAAAVPRRGGRDERRAGLARAAARPVEVWGVESLAGTEVQLRMVVRARPGRRRPEAARELRRRVPRRARRGPASAPAPSREIADHPARPPGPSPPAATDHTPRRTRGAAHLRHADAREARVRPRPPRPRGHVRVRHDGAGQAARRAHPRLALGRADAPLPRAPRLRGDLRLQLHRRRRQDHRARERRGRGLRSGERAQHRRLPAGSPTLHNIQPRHALPARHPAHRRDARADRGADRRRATPTPRAATCTSTSARRPTTASSRAATWTRCARATRDRGRARRSATRSTSRCGRAPSRASRRGRARGARGAPAGTSSARRWR